MRIEFQFGDFCLPQDHLSNGQTLRSREINAMLQTVTTEFMNKFNSLKLKILLDGCYDLICL